MVTRGRLAWVQHRPHKPNHEGSIPSRATTRLSDAWLAALLALANVLAWGALAWLVAP